MGYLVIQANSSLDMKLAESSGQGFCNEINNQGINHSIKGRIPAISDIPSQRLWPLSYVNETLQTPYFGILALVVFLFVKGNTRYINREWAKATVSTAKGLFLKQSNFMWQKILMYI